MKIKSIIFVLVLATAIGPLNCAFAQTPQQKEQKDSQNQIVPTQAQQEVLGQLLEASNKAALEAELAKQKLLAAIYAVMAELKISPTEYDIKIPNGRLVFELKPKTENANIKKD